MGKTFDRELIRLLRDAGCSYVPVTKVHFTAPEGIASRHTANAVLKQAGLSKAF